MKYIIILLVLFNASQLSAATYYIRNDGGNHAQCTGLVDAPYTTGNACAWNHPFEAFPPKDIGFTSPVVGSDTIIIKNGDYRMGYTAGLYDKGDCKLNWPWACQMSSVPSGTPENPTRVLGEGWNSTTPHATRPELWGAAAAKRVFDLTNSANVEVQNLEITDRETCGENYHQKEDGTLLSCFKNSIDSNHAGTGIVSGLMNTPAATNSSTNVLLKNLYIHGMAAQGLLVGRVSNWTIEDCDILHNGKAGFDGDLGKHSVIPSFTGEMNFKNTRINWTGCIEYWDNPGTIPPDGCYGQGDMGGGYGDAVGLGEPVGNAAWTFDNIDISHNVSDGLDFLYGWSASDGSIVVKNSHFESNAGNPLKLGFFSLVYNNEIVSDCGFFTGKPFWTTPASMTPCRGGGALIIKLFKDAQYYVINNSFAGESSSMFGLEGSYGKAVENNAAEIGTENVYSINNTFSSLPKQSYPAANSDYYYIYETKSDFLDRGWHSSHNIYHGTPQKRYNQCSELGSKCDVDPLYVAKNKATDSYDLRLASALSPAKDAGLPEGTLIVTDSKFGDIRVPLIDNLQGTRTLADIGMYEYGATVALTCQNTPLLCETPLACTNAGYYYYNSKCNGTPQIIPTEPTCTDGIMNGNETGTDCGGSCPNACAEIPTCAPIWLFKLGNQTMKVVQ